MCGVADVDLVGAARNDTGHSRVGKRELQCRRLDVNLSTRCDPADVSAPKQATQSGRRLSGTHMHTQTTIILPPFYVEGTADRGDLGHLGGGLLIPDRRTRQPA